MKKIAVFIAIFLSVGTVCSALDIPCGTFYFDNSLTQYTHVKFVYGSDSRAETYVCSMTLDEEMRWKITFDSSQPDFYRYTFAETSLPDGRIDSTFSVVKEHISKTLAENRTATTDAAIMAGYIFVPSSGDNWAQGTWQFLVPGDVTYSGTLPVLFVDTDDGTPITSKEVYLSGKYYLDNLGLAGYTSIGTSDAPLTLEIRGRGNYTWSGFDKKPYRLKLADKQPLLGMTANRHFALLAHADDDLAFLRNTVGFELSRRLGLAWTPTQQPVELVLNGDYVGLYLLTENIRVAKSRVNIEEQANRATDAAEITGGWLVEIDNYDSDPHITITEGNGESIYFTYKSPDTLSAAQANYLTAQVTAMDAAIYARNKNSTDWERLIDLDALARFYIVQEVMDNAESFHGSCYLYKRRGDNEKWTFGPVWDFGNAYHRAYGVDENRFIYDMPPFGQTWIGEIAQYPRFQAKVREIWKQFRANDFASLYTFIDDFCDRIAAAAQNDYARWPQYGNADIAQRKAVFLDNLRKRTAWLVEQWGDATALPHIDSDTQPIVYSSAKERIQIVAEQPMARVEIYNMVGQCVAQGCSLPTETEMACPSGLHIVRITSDGGQSFTQKVLVK